MLLLLLSCFSCVRLCETPWMAAHQAPLSLGFSRQEHWSGLPFPSPMYESEKWKWSRSVVSDSQQPHGLQPTRLLCPRDFPGKSTGVGCHCLLQSKAIHDHVRWGFSNWGMRNSRVPGICPNVLGRILRCLLRFSSPNIRALCNLWNFEHDLLPVLYLGYVICHSQLY